MLWIMMLTILSDTCELIFLARYIFGRQWPNLRESDFDHIGANRGVGFNCNIPLNKVGKFMKMIVWSDVSLRNEMLPRSQGGDDGRGLFGSLAPSGLASSG